MEAQRVYTLRSLALITLFCIALAYPTMPLLTLITDSEQYTQMSRSMLTADFYKAADGTDIPLALALRPPMYPIMLLLADHFPRVPFEQGIVLTHLLLAYAVLILAPFILRRVLPPVATICATGMALYSNKQMLFSHMSEFLSSLFLLGSLFCLILYLSNPSGLRAAATTLCTSLAILTRLALLPWSVIVLIMALYCSKERRTAFITGALIGLAPLILWSSLNLHRLGHFSLGAHGSYMFIAAARTLGEIPHSARETSEAATLIDVINTQGRGVSEHGWQQDQVQKWDGEYYQAYHWNFGLAWGPLRQYTPQVSAPSLFVRTVHKHLEKYGAFLRGSLFTFFSDYSFSFIACLLAQAGLFFLPHLRHRHVALANTIICALSMLYMSSVLSAFLWVHRYYTSIQPLMIFSMMSTLLLIVRERGYFRQHKESE